MQVMRSALAVSARLNLPADVLDYYEQRAKTYNSTLNDVLSARLSQCASYDAKAPIYFNDEQRQRLNALLGNNFRNAEEVIKAVESALTVKIGTVAVNPSPDLLQRLKTRCHYEEFPAFVGKTTVECLEQFVGLR